MCLSWSAVCYQPAVDIRPAGAMKCLLQEWLVAGGVSLDVDSSVGRELNDFLARVSQCGPPYQQWCDDIKQYWNIAVSGYPYQQWCDDIKQYWNIAVSGYPYQQWCDDIKQYWNIAVSGYSYQQWCDDIKQYWNIALRDDSTARYGNILLLNSVCRYHDIVVSQVTPLHQ